MDVVQRGIRSPLAPSLASRLLGVAMGAVLVAAVFAWLAAGDVNDASAATAAARSSLAGTIALADATAALATQVQATNDALVTATGSAGEASGWTVAISQNVRGLIEALTGSSGAFGAAGADSKQIDDVRNALGEAEASLLETEGGLNESNSTLAGNADALGDAVTTLQALPEQLRAAADDLSSASSDADTALVLWRLAIVLTALVLLLVLVVLLQHG